MRAPFVLASILVLASVAGPVLAQEPVIVDPSGDVEMASYSATTAPPGDWSPIDLRTLTILETADELQFIVQVERLSDCTGGQCYDAGDLRSYFRYGTQWYYVQQGMNSIGNAYAQLAQTQEGNVQGTVIAGQLGATFDRVDNTVTANVPREFIVDESGSPPAKGRSLEGIHTRSYSQYSFGGPEVDGSDDMLVIRDRMGFEEMGSFLLSLGGRDRSGPIELWSASPYRASNGGATTYRYDIAVRYDGEGATTFNITTRGVPATWTFERPAGDLPMERGDNRTFSVLLHTPSGHRHGGTDVFQIVLEDTQDADTWASIDLGVHYLQIPQPAGHHPTLFLHTLTDGVATELIAAFGPDTGRIWMNTLEDDPGDEQVPIVGREGPQGFIEQTTRWSVCLIPNLRLGLDFDLGRTGQAIIPIGAVAPHNGVTLTGRLLHLDGPSDLDFCDPSLYANSVQTELAILDGGEPADILNLVNEFELTVTPRPESDLVPYRDGAQLVLELQATYAGGDPSHGGLALHPGGRINLPLLEYQDDRPQGFVAGSEVPEPIDELGSFEEVGAKVESPGLPAAMALVAFALFLLRRRA